MVHFMHPTSQAKCNSVFQMSAQGKNRGSGDFQMEWQRRESPCAAHYLESARAEADNRIVNRPHNRSIVGQNHVGDRT